MAFSDFPRSSQFPIDRKLPLSYFEEQDISEDSILESEMISPTSTDDRRDSFGNNTAPVFSPQSTSWEDHYTTAALPERQHFVGTNNPFEQQNNNPFTRLDSAAFNQHNTQWPMFDQPTESRTPVVSAVYEPYPGDFDATQSSAFSAAPAVSAFGSVRPTSVFPPAATPISMPTSPHGKDYMAMAEQQAMDSRPYPKRMRQNSPPRPYSPFPRRDGGIRKKNAKFNIPPERTLETVDQLIANSTNDDEIKELKQQKRLLRNRQAALDSRQRKKQRAEELEEENKKWTNQITLLEDEIQKLHMQNDCHVREKEQLIVQRAQFQEQIQDLTEEKVIMVERHTNETGDLRAKIAVLTEQLEIAANAMPERSSSGEYNDFTNEMNGLTMAPNDWEFLVNDYVMESESTPPRPQETSLVLASKKKEALLDEEQPAASGLLMLLLLCGAWVASKTTNSSMPAIPRMSDDVRAASAVVLDSVMKDAGVSDPSHAFSGMSEPTTSGAARQLPFHMAEATTRNHRLDAVHTKLVNPSKAQAAEAAFSLSVQQYDGLTTEFTRPGYSSGSSDDEAITPSTTASSHRRNLADTLKAMRDDAKGESAANVYTRSLLWDRIPTDVVQEFKRMVEESGTSGEGGGGGDD